MPAWRTLTRAESGQIGTLLSVQITELFLGIHSVYQPIKSLADNRDLEQEFRDRLAVVRSQVEQESDVLLQQVERERGALQEELWLLQAQEAALQEELHATAQVSSPPWLSVLLPVHVFHYLIFYTLNLLSELIPVTQRCLD